MKDFCCLDLKCSVMLFFTTFVRFVQICWLNKVFSSNMFELICDPLHSLVRQLKYECHRNHA